MSLTAAARSTRAVFFALAVILAGCAKSEPTRPVAVAVSPPSAPASTPVPSQTDDAPPPDLTAEGAVDYLNRAAAKSPYQIPQDPAKSDRQRADALEWYKRVTVGGFEANGNTAAPWADKARAALAAVAREFAEVRFVGSPGTAAADAARLLDEAVAAGCDDPLVKALAFRRELTGRLKDPADLTKRYAAAVTALRDSRHSDLVKLAAYSNLTTLLSLPVGDAAVREERQAEWEAEYAKAFARVAADPDKNAQGEAMTHARLRLNRFVPGRDRKANFDEVDERLAKAGAAAYVRLMTKAAFLVSYAWDARGGGSADTVGPEGWRLFRERLDQAHDALNEAWTADPSRPEAPTEMLPVGMGLELPPPVMARWFKRAMEANPDNADACRRMLTALHPKWGGTEAGHLTFAWQCVRTGNHRAGIPIAAAAALFEDMPVVAVHPEMVRRAYADPLRWAVLHAALSETLAARPDDRAVRSLLARALYLTGRYPDAVREFDKLGTSFEPGVFTSKAEFVAMADDAREKATGSGAQPAPETSRPKDR